FRDKFVSELSTGSRRIVDLAMAIAHDPTVLILDEPSSGIAQRETEALGPLLMRIKEETGCSMLVIEHDMPLITGISDQILALELGAVVTIGTPDEVIRDPRVVESYLGGDINVIQRSGTVDSGPSAEAAPVTEEVPAVRPAAVAEKSPARRAPARKPAAKRAPAKKAAPTKAAANTAAKKAPAQKSGARPRKRTGSE
ncbi:MAG TPA: ATP-binding cassette domain-containing protein, partial [Acidimicrobiales bacterium]|nr:ATP-binding cassette domain-containing protein [Acidimicrobiales bacterium]